MAKAELFSKKIGAWFFGKQLGAFPVKRGAGDTGAIDTAKEIVNSGKLLGIFPEGTALVMDSWAGRNPALH